MTLEISSDLLKKKNCTRLNISLIYRLSPANENIVLFELPLHIQSIETPPKVDLDLLIIVRKYGITNKKTFFVFIILLYAS
ncbi:hypothetical protein KFK09_004118 [Dendrobium nobile]|uniref:Uncharacterized protein n=1 Tax=Dendrobium nobile TaxID=94219 RepID=A0A8T3C212_DENNO|nr:hypothetical protein KFK09_004118 [Dendrobium nobile]